jgi:hypothetical protein
MTLFATDARRDLRVEMGDKFGNFAELAPGWFPFLAFSFAFAIGFKSDSSPLARKTATPFEVTVCGVSSPPCLIPPDTHRGRIGNSVGDKRFT